MAFQPVKEAVCVEHEVQVATLQQSGSVKDSIINIL